MFNWKFREYNTEARFRGASLQECCDILSKICTAVQGFAVLELFGVRLERQVGSRRAELGSGVGPNVRLGQSLVGAVRSVVPLDAVLSIGEDLLDAGREPSAFRLSIDRLVHLQTKFK